MIEVKKITKEYSTGQTSFKALDNVSLKIEAGEFVAIMGPSGSGKSTMLHILGFLDKPEQGSYLFNGKNTANFTDAQYATLRREHIGFVFQQFHLIPRVSVLQNVQLPLIYSGKKHLKQRSWELLEQVGLKAKASNLPNELSGGEKQRIAIARSLINDPQVIMADEPTGNLDSKNAAEILKIFSTLNQQGKTIIMVTHEESVARLARRVIRFKDGQIVSDQQTGAQTAEHARIKTAKPEAAITNTWQFIDYLKQSIRMITSNKIRSFLSMLGILIGVATVVAMLTLGAGATDSISQSLSRLGTNMVTVFPQRHGINTNPLRLTARDAELIAGLPYTKRLSPKVQGNAKLINGNKNLSSQIEGTTEVAVDMANNKPAFGRYFSKEEVTNREKVAVIGQTVARELFGQDNPINQTIKINRINFIVIGVLPAIGGGGWRDQDSVVKIPVTTAMYRLLGKDFYDNIDVEITDFNQTEEAVRQISDILIKQHNLEGDKQESFRVLNMAEIQKTATDTANNLSFLISFIAFLSLLVGGIGIMNIMLVSVTERTREIGIRKAIGARKSDIMLQFVTESIMMTFTGGILGITLGLAIATGLSLLANWAIKITPATIIMAASFSVTIGLIFGIWPAQKAAGLAPVEALRYE